MAPQIQALASQITDDSEVVYRPLEAFFLEGAWHKGEIVRDKFEVRVPAAWSTDGMAFSLVVDDGQRQALEGPHPGGDTGAVTLGILPITGAPAAPPPTVPPTPAPPPPPAPVPTMQAPGTSRGSQAAPRP